MPATLTTTCNALNWVIGKAHFLGSEDIHPDVSNGETVIHSWAFRGQLNERMVRDIQAFITITKQTQKTYGNRVIVEGYEIDCSQMANARDAWRSSSHIVISKAE